MRLRRGRPGADAEHLRWPALMADRAYRRLTVVGLALVLVALAGAGVVSRFGASPTGAAGPGSAADPQDPGATGRPSTMGATPSQRPTTTPTPVATTPSRTTAPRLYRLKVGAILAIPSAQTFLNPTSRRVGARR